MDNKFLLVFAFMLALGTALAAEEVSLRELGYNSTEAKGIEVEQCSEFVFSIPDPGIEFYPIISIKAEFYPAPSGEAGVSLKLNGKAVGSFGIDDFRCTAESCWLRAELERGQVLKENTLKACIRTGRNATRAVLSNESLIGYYKKPVFREQGFVSCVLLDSGECVESYDAALGEDLNIILKIVNEGTGLSYVDLRNRKELAGITQTRKEIGQTSFEGVINPGETKVLSYTIRIESAVPMQLPPAIAKYQNVFGEEESLKSNLVFINPKGEPALTTAIGIESVNSFSRETLFTVTIFNKEIVPISNAKIDLNLGKGLELAEGSQEIELPLLEAKQAKSFTLKAKAQGNGDFKIGCTFSADGLKEKTCNPATVSFREENPVLLAGATILLLAAGGAIYFYIHTREEYGK
ncbi:MAG: hypothetical protein NT067_06645 [Candidatus Diapherotrites archaeon]|nr:hypothetical protein [Candidatus Diapherotrites archaeon]